DLKNAAGGLTDCEFLSQYLILAHAHEEPLLIGRQPDAVFMIAREKGWLDPKQAALLIDGYRMLRDVLHWRRLAVKGDFKSDETPPQVRTRIAAAVGMPTPKALDAHLADLRAQVRAIFRRMLGLPAAGSEG